jgi:ABC-type sugar transport system ATPase subunit
MSDRVLIMNAGRVDKQLEKEYLSRENVIYYATRAL